MIPIRHIQQAAADHYEITRADILGPSRKPIFCHPRQLAMSIAKGEGYSLPQIGRDFRRDHTTVRSNVARVKQRAGSSQSIARHQIRAKAQEAHEAEKTATPWVFRTRRNLPTFTTQRNA